MKNDIQIMRERKSTNEKLMFALSIGIDSDIAQMRILCDKFIDKDEIDAEKIVVCADKIKTQVDKYKKLQEQNNQISEELGE